MNVKLTPLDAMEKLLYVNTDDDLVYKLPVLEDMYHRNMPAIHVSKQQQQQQQQQITTELYTKQ